MIKVQYLYDKGTIYMITASVMKELIHGFFFPVLIKRVYLIF